MWKDSSFCKEFFRDCSLVETGLITVADAWMIGMFCLSVRWNWLLKLRVTHRGDALAAEKANWAATWATCPLLAKTKIFSSVPLQLKIDVSFRLCDFLLLFIFFFGSFEWLVAFSIIISRFACSLKLFKVRLVWLDWQIHLFHSICFGFVDFDRWHHVWLSYQLYLKFDIFFRLINSDVLNCWLVDIFKLGRSGFIYWLWH